MPEFFQYNPHNGITEFFDYDESTGNVMITSIAPGADALDAFLDMTHETRAVGKTDKGLMDNGREFHCYASLPAIVQLQLRQKGIDIYSKDPTMMRRMFDEINTNYPWCKTTYKSHR
jgi:hypothetical protein